MLFPLLYFFFFFFFNDPATTEIYTLSLHDALPIYGQPPQGPAPARGCSRGRAPQAHAADRRSEEHTSELQSSVHLVCRLLLEKKNHTSISLHRVKKKTTNHAK